MDLSKLIQLKQNSPDNKPLEIKNYKELCNILDEEVKSGNSKQKQIKNWKRYFSWKCVGYSYLISNIYEKPLPEEENMLKYKIIQYSILETLKQHYNNQKINNEELSAYSQTINSLAFNIGFVNESYFAFMYNKKQLSQLLDMNYKNIEEFYDKVSKYYYDDLTTALNRMAKKGWIIFNEVYMGDFITDEHKIIVQSNDDFGDKKNEVKLDYITETKPLSAKELQIYKNLNSQAFLHFGCSDYSEYIKKYNSSIPLQKYRNSLIIQELNCTSVYKIYQIAALPEHLELCQNTLSKQLNSNFLNRIIKNKQTLVANQIKEKEDYYDTYPIYNENNKLKTIDSIKQSLNDFKILAKCLVSNDKKDLDRFETLTKYFNRKINFQHEQNNRAVKALQGLSKQEVDDILSNQSIIINDDFI